MSETVPIISDDDISAALNLVEELRGAGRDREASALMRVVAYADASYQEKELRDLAPLDDGAEDAAAPGHDDEDVLAGRLIPHDVVLQGPAAVEEYKRLRDGGQLTPEMAAELERVRRTLLAEQPAARGG
ncbi:MAG: hypothetical protein ACRDJN_13145 [Chloroflexota bacterium]